MKLFKNETESESYKNIGLGFSNIVFELYFIHKNFSANQLENETGINITIWPELNIGISFIGWTIGLNFRKRNDFDYQIPY